MVPVRKCRPVFCLACKSIFAGQEGRKTDHRHSNAEIIRGCYFRRACYAPTHRESPGEPIFMPDAETSLLPARLQFAFHLRIHLIFPSLEERRVGKECDSPFISWWG